ncbi:RNHCP domain-containing protein [Nonomuraea typhae]|uniref:RNHCP domain-containing protein n=1 Tax=Nonomuraea typhae TaxID=2603600 RepID=UPI0012FB4648|nr:RNHCP domain-containing protein [Nonomuraea typhae]
MSDCFTCPLCGLAPGDRRNHCPECLTGVHPGDGARMAPIAVAVPREGEWVIVHRCERCGWLASSPARADDNVLILMRMAVRPLASPPFPFEMFGRM